MDGKTIIILILSSLLSAAIGYLYAQKTECGRRRLRFPRRAKRAKQAKQAKQAKSVQAAKPVAEPAIVGKSPVKPDGSVKGEPAEIQSGVAQYMIENGL